MLLRNFNNLLLTNKIIIFWWVGVLFFSPMLAQATVEKIVFTTEPQMVAPGQMSGSITIQTQTSDGIKEDVTETMDLIFSSDSSTGEFLGSTGNPVTKYMSKNSANRTFYYRDSLLGEHIISVEATGRDSGHKFSASQKITVSDTPVATSTDEDDSQTASSTAAVIVSGGGNYSAHSSQTDLSDYEEPTPSIGAGRKRLAIVGSPLDFKVEQSKGASGINRYAWSFGDGTSAEGEQVSHGYKFPGEYNVVLNGYWGNTQLVARTKVLVEEAKVVLAKIDQRLGFAEVVNNGQKEINLGHWVLRGAIDTPLPLDTIIDAGKSIKVPLDPKIFTATSSQLVLISADGYEVVKGEGLSILELENKLLQLKEQLMALQFDPDQSLAGGEVLTGGEIENNDQKPTAKIITLEPKLSWWQKMFRIGK